jgi:hypothetical protein
MRPKLPLSVLNGDEQAWESSATVLTGDDARLRLTLTILSDCTPVHQAPVGWAAFVVAACNMVEKAETLVADIGTQSIACLAMADGPAWGYTEEELAQALTPVIAKRIVAPILNDIAGKLRDILKEVS